MGTTHYLFFLTHAGSFVGGQKNSAVLYNHSHAESFGVVCSRLMFAWWEIQASEIKHVNDFPHFSLWLFKAEM